MKEIIESLLGVFFLTLIITTSMSCIAASIDYRNADATKTAYIAEIENSNFSSKVIQSVYEHAESDGYTVAMKLYHRQGDGTELITTPTSADDVGNTNDVYMVRLQLDFDYSFQFFNIVTQHSLIGYAR